MWMRSLLVGRMRSGNLRRKGVRGGVDGLGALRSLSLCYLFG